MRVIKDKDGGIVRRVLLLDDGGEPVVPVVRYLGHLIDAGYSPHTACAYGYDLRYLFEFLGAEGVSWQAFGPSTALIFLGHLRRRPTRRPAQRLGLAVATGEGRLLAPATVQRVLAATSSFYEWAIAAGEYAEPENPLRREIDPALARVPERHQPFVGTASRQRPVRRAVRVRLPMRLPRPLEGEEVQAVLDSMATLRDLAMTLLMLDGGLRPGEVLGLHLDDVAYGRRRVTIRKRDDHPHGARGKSRHERVVDLHQPRTLDAVSRYVLHERPLVQHIAAHRIQRPRLVQIDYPLVPGLPTSAVRMVVALADRHPPTAVGDVVQVQTQDLPWTQAAIEHQQRHRQVPQRCHAVQHRLHLLALQRTGQPHRQPDPHRAAHRPLPARRAHERLVPLGNSGQRGGDLPLVEARRRRQHPLHRRRRQQPPPASGHRQPQPLRGTPRWTTPQMTQEDQRSRGPERLPAHTLGAQELKQVSQVVAVRACRVRAVPSVDQMTEVPDDRHDGLTPVIKQQHPPNDAAVLVLDDAHPGSSPPAPTGSGGQPPAGEANVAACPDNRELRQGGEDRVPLRSVAPTRQVGTLASSTSVGGGLEGGQGPSSSVGSCPGPALDHVRVPAPCGCPLGFAVGAGEPGRRWRSLRRPSRDRVERTFAVTSGSGVHSWPSSTAS